MTNATKLIPLFILSFLTQSAWASEIPLSGTFSNVKNKERSGYTESMRIPMNLVVTIGKSGQQFFVQCFKGEQAGFGVATVLKTPMQEAKIKAGPECPARELLIELDYNEAFVRFGDRFVYLPRGNIIVPIEP